jgi:hypothetical protein
MTKEQIIELLKNSKWTSSGSKLFTDDEFSESLAVWDKDFAFIIHCVRNKNFKDNVLLVVTQVRPFLKFDAAFESVEALLNNDGTKHMLAEQLLNNKEEHNDFLNTLNYDNR